MAVLQVDLKLIKRPQWSMPSLSHFLIRIMKYIFSLLFVSTILSSCNKVDDTRPNILFIMSDDHAYQAISAYDDRLINTPNIDRLADGG